MAFNINRVTIVGRLGADAEMRSFQNGGAVVNMRVATSESWKDRNGEKQERTEWHTVAVFAKWLIDDASKLRKGDLVMIEGKLQTRKWQTQSGDDRYSTEIVLQGMESSVFKMAPRDRAGGQQGGGGGGGGDWNRGGGSGSGGGAGASSDQRWGGGHTSGTGGGGSNYDDLDDDIPF